MKSCAVADCPCVPLSCGLCSIHMEELKAVKGRIRRTRWLRARNCYNSRTGDFRSSGNDVEDVCLECGNFYVRKEHCKESSGRCTPCLVKQAEPNLKKLVERNEKDKLRRKLTPENDPRYKIAHHTGSPKTVTWECEKPGCGKQYEVTLRENKVWYHRYCRRCFVS